MWLRVNARCAPEASLKPLTALLWLWLALFPAPLLAASAPSAEQTMNAYAALDGWVRAWSIPAEPRHIDPDGSSGAAVTLRLSGRILARATSMNHPGANVWAAARLAWLEADEALPVERDALREANLRDLTPHITIDLEISGPLTPLIAESEAALAAEFSPGYHGVAARLTDTTEGVFPGVMLSTDRVPLDAVRIAAARLGLPAAPLDELLRKRSLVVYRFEARHLAQTDPAQQPVFLYRGGRIVPLAEINAQRLRTAADDMADNLIRRRWAGPEPHGLLGDYHPAIDRYEPTIAEPLPQAVAAFALAKYASLPGAPADRAARAVAAARSILLDLTSVTPDEQDPLSSPLSAAMWIVADSALRDAAPALSADDRTDFTQRAGELVRSCWDGAAWTRSAPTSGRSLLAFALVCAASDDAERAGAGRAVRALFRDTDAQRLPGELPWLGWAELRLAQHSETVPAGDALRAARELVWRFQVLEEGASPSLADIAGGVVFTRGREGLPTWHTLRPLAFLATAAGDPRLTGPDEAIDEIANLRRSLRFLVQLLPAEAECAMYRDPDRARGGVRQAVWDQRQTVEATSLGLLCTVETLRSMHEIAGRR